MNELFDYLFKIISLGNLGAGKTTLSWSFVDTTFSDPAAIKYCLDFKSRILQIDDFRIKMQVWDSCGAEKYGGPMASYFRGVAGVLFVYDITDRKSFDDINRWVSKLDEHTTDTRVVKILVGTKLDLGEEKRQVSTEQGKIFAESLGFSFYEVSAKTGDNVDEVFTEIARCTLQSHFPDIVEDHNANNDNSSKRKRKKKEEKKDDGQITLVAPQPQMYRNRMRCI